MSWRPRYRYIDGQLHASSFSLPILNPRLDLYRRPPVVRPPSLWRVPNELAGNWGLFTLRILDGNRELLRCFTYRRGMLWLFSIRRDWTRIVFCLEIPFLSRWLDQHRNKYGRQNSRWRLDA